jgi:hypothetical protein
MLELLEAFYGLHSGKYDIMCIEMEDSVCSYLKYDQDGTYSIMDDYYIIVDIHPEQIGYYIEYFYKTGYKTILVK